QGITGAASGTPLPTVCLMDVSLKHPGELTFAEVDAWRVLRAGDAAYDNPFFAPEFARAVGGVREDARVVVVRGVSGSVELVLPVQLAASGLARPLGAPMCDVNGPVATPDMREKMGQVLAKAGIAAYAFSGWPDVRAMHGLKLRGREGSAVADLSRGFAAWLEEQRDLHAKHFKKMRRLARQGESDFGAETVTFGAARAEDLATLIQWKRDQFMRTRRHDVLRPAWTRGLLEACAAHKGEAFAGVMATLRYGGRLAAAEFGLRSGGVLHGWIAGYDPEFASCSPGLVLQERLLEQAAAEGVTQAVLGTGEGHYKKHYASHYTAVDDGVVTASGMSGGARALAAGLLHAVESGRFGPAAKLAGRTRRRLDVILAVETRMGDQVRGVTRALTEDPALARTSTALKAAVQASAI
ncbi:MAG: GNAT family N-acetyltransferase, partial [Hyphomonadaceae bacterium]|nr:GNAT family N-acetyltransferase [Hyphomonadaceae bacterium]